MIRALGLWVVAGSLACTPPAPRAATAPGFASADKATQVGRYRVQLSVRPDPPPLGELFQVDAIVRDKTGTPLETAKVLLDARMPQHDHGMETRPRVREGVCEANDTDDDDTDARRCRHPEGRYTADGFKFHMSGAWTVQVEIDGPAGPDSTTFIYEMP